ncbi:MAG: hypothetical protein ACUVX8_04200 [Candidatus Zipacnadales bacterium]
MKKITYGDWKNCYRLTNGEMEVVVVADIGPRIIRLARPGGPNLLGELGSDVGEGEWRIYGGHRLWHAPEALPRSYEPDNEPCEVETSADAVRVTGKTEPHALIQKRIEVSLAEDDKCATIRHTLWNRGMWPVTLAPWALTVMQTEGYSIAPYPRGEFTSLLPCGPLVLWPYDDLRDPRLTLGSNHVIIHQDPKLSRRLKIGLASTEGWAGWTKDGDLFIKRFDPVPDGMYPDFGCAVELFANDLIAEVETIAPLTTLDPGESVVHVERWYLFTGVDFDGTEEAIEKNVLPCVKGTR